MGQWRGDYEPLARHVAEQLTTGNLELVAEAASVLGSCHPVTASSAGALAIIAEEQRAAHGPAAWCAADHRLRRAHQLAVVALARFGDERAVPSLIVALDSGVDSWRAVQAAARLPQAAGELSARLCARLHRVGLTGEHDRMSTDTLLSAIAALGDTASVPAVIEILDAAVMRGSEDVLRPALKTLAAFGPAAASALGTLRRLAASSDSPERPEVITALWATGGDREEVLPLAISLLAGTSSVRIRAASPILADIGPAASAATSRLRELLSHTYEWVRVPAATALWEIEGESEADAVLRVLTAAWEKNPFTGSHVVACLERMGPAAVPALPRLLAEMAQARRGGSPHSDIATDEDLLQRVRSLITRLA